MTVKSVLHQLHCVIKHQDLHSKSCHCRVCHIYPKGAGPVVVYGAGGLNKTRLDLALFFYHIRKVVDKLP